MIMINDRPWMRNDGFWMTNYDGDLEGIRRNGDGDDKL